MKKTLILFALLPILSFAQNDKVIFKEYEPGYYQNTILKDVKQFQSQEKNNTYKYLSVDFSKNIYPTNIDDYTTVWRNNPVSQGIAGTCWCFSATSFMESEVKRLTDQEVKLSEMYTVYWEYVERTIDFVKTRGETYFNEGSEANAIPKIWKKYGIVPIESYQGKPADMPFYDHRKMFDEMEAYLKSVKEKSQWNEELVVSTIKSILNNYMGVPPATIKIEGKEITPKEYLENILKLKMNDYYSFMSTMEFTFNEKHELVEADNWWHGDNYYNISLNDYFQLIVDAIEKGYSISICGDVSEPGHDSWSEVSIVPSFDIPSEYINDESRQFRLSNQTTTDDHCIHLVGYKKVEDEYWFLIKDSGSGGFDGEHKGYRFMRQDYVKLKMMNIMIHKGAARKVLDKIIK